MFLSLNKFFSLFTITRPVIILSILFTPAAVAFLANRGIPPFTKTILGILVATTAIAGAHTFNDFCDRDIDSLNPRTKNRPLPARIITPRFALGYSLFLLSSSMFFASLINTFCLVLISIGIVLIILYSLKLKRTIWGFILPALGAALLPLGSWATYKPENIFSQIPLLIAILGFFIEIPPYFCETIMDTQEDKDKGVYTLPVSWGIKFTSKLMFFCYVISLIIIIYLWKIINLESPYLLITTILGSILLKYYVNFIKFPDITKTYKLFNFTMAYIVIWSTMVILEIILR